MKMELAQREKAFIPLDQRDECVQRINFHTPLVSSVFRTSLTQYILLSAALPRA